MLPVWHKCAAVTRPRVVWGQSQFMRLWGTWGQTFPCDLSFSVTKKGRRAKWASWMLNWHRSPWWLYDQDCLSYDYVQYVFKMCLVSESEDSCYTYIYMSVYNSIVVPSYDSFSYLFVCFPQDTCMDLLLRHWPSWHTSESWCCCCCLYVCVCGIVNWTASQDK